MFSFWELYGNVIVVGPEYNLHMKCKKCIVKERSRWNSYEADKFNMVYNENNTIINNKSELQADFKYTNECIYV